MMPDHRNNQSEKKQLAQGVVTFDVAACYTDSSKKTKSIHFIITHSKAHAEWAAGAKAQLLDSLSDLAPSLNASVDLLLIQGAQNDVAEMLAQYSETYSKKEAEKTFIITPGWWESQAVVLANVNRILPYKQLFCLPNGEPGKLLQSALDAQTEETVMGGVYNVPMSSVRYVNSVLGFRPQAKKVCIVYDPETSSELLRQNLGVQVAELEEHFTKAHIEVVKHHWTPQDMRIEQLRDAAYGADSIVILNEPAAAVHKIALIGFCRAWNIFVCASELDSVRDGAALGCGISGAAFAVPLAALIVEYLFLERGLEQTMAWSLHRIPQQSGMRFNWSALESQGVTLPKDREELMLMKSVFDIGCTEY